MNKVVWFILLFGFSQVASAQRMLVFINENENRVIEVAEGQQLCLLYKGYLGQTEFVKSVVSEITDSTITLGIEKVHGSKTGPSFKVIRIADILAFRRITIGKQLLKSTVQIGSVVGLYLLANQVYSSPDIGNGGAFAISLGAGISTRLLINLLFPEKVKYYIRDGWQISTHSKL